MISRIEGLPNEIILHIFSHLSWFDMLTSFWSLNIRFNSLVCFSFSISNTLLKIGVHLTEQSLSYKKCSSILFPLILRSPSLCSSIQCIHFGGTNSIADNLSYQWLFNDKKILHFPNLKSLILTRCRSIEPVVQSLFYLIEHQLDELTLTFDKFLFRRMNYIRKTMPIYYEIGN